MHADLPAQRDNELQAEPELALTPLTPQPQLAHVLKELGLADLQTAITNVNSFVMQGGDVEAVDSWKLCLNFMGRFLTRDLTTRRKLANARAQKSEPKLTEETYQDALRRAPAEARRRGVKNSKKLLAQLIDVSTAHLREWESANGK